MVINPNSDIILYSGMPLDDTYTDTLYFDTLAAQTAFFMDNAYVKRRFAANTYQRVNSGVFDAQCLADEIYDCNYMAFRNTNFGAKWFYAFVNSVEYVNNGMARVTFTIDVMQTYLFDAELEECMIDRQHTETDIAGENITPEPISINDYTFQWYKEFDAVINGSSIYEVDVCVMVCDVGEDSSTRAIEGYLYGNVYSGSTIWAFGPLGKTPADPPGPIDPLDPPAVLAGIDSKLRDYIQKPDAIVNMYLTPHFITQGTSGGRELKGYAANSYTAPTIEWNKPSSFDDFVMIGEQPYTPKNKKLYTYPYSYLHIDNSNGQSLALRFEFFHDFLDRGTSAKFRIFGSPMPPVQFTLAPQNYKGNTGTLLQAPEPLMSEKITLDNYPICSWNYDTYKAWIAQNSVNVAFDMGRSILGTAASGQSMGGGYGAMGGAAAGAINGAVTFAQSDYNASIQADVCRGNINCGNANFVNGLANFRIGRAQAPIQQLKIIDDFFTMYGYAIRRVARPNINARPHYTYIKTSGSKVIGKCPADDLKQICNIYDAGITFWKSAGNVGNYELDNSPA